MKTLRCFKVYRAYFISLRFANYHAIKETIDMFYQELWNGKGTESRDEL